METKYKLEYEFETNRDYKVVDGDLITLNKKITFDSCPVASGSGTNVSTIDWRNGNLQKTTTRSSGNGTWIYLHPDGVQNIEIGRYDLILTKGNTTDEVLAFGDGSNVIDNIIWPHINPSVYYPSGKIGQKIFMTFRWDSNMNKYIGMASPWYGEETGTVARTVSTAFAFGLGLATGSSVIFYNNTLGLSYFGFTDSAGSASFDVESGITYVIQASNQILARPYSGSVTVTPSGPGHNSITLFAETLGNRVEVNIRVYVLSDLVTPKYYSGFLGDVGQTYSFSPTEFLLLVPEGYPGDGGARIFQYWVINGVTNYGDPLNGTYSLGVNLNIELIYDDQI